jgi:predicted dienelactone hydrolase
MLEQLRRVDAERDPDAIRRFWRESKRLYSFVLPSVPVWQADVRFVLDQLTRIDAGDATDVTGAWTQFAGRLDLERIGVMGQSFGGSTAGLVCRDDRRCKAGVNMDGFQFGDKPMAIPAPFMFMANGGTMNVAAYESTAADLYQLRVRRSAHGDFSALPLIAPLFSWISRPGMELLGTIDGHAMQRVMNAYLLAFFAQHLVGSPQPLLAATSPVAGFEDAQLSRIPQGAPIPAAAMVPAR